MDSRRRQCSDGRYGASIDRSRCGYEVQQSLHRSLFILKQWTVRSPPLSFSNLRASIGSQPYGRVTAQSKLLFFSVRTVLVEPALGAAGADLQVQPASIGEARLLAIRWADGVAAVGIGQHGVHAFLGGGTNSRSRPQGWGTTHGPPGRMVAGFGLKVGVQLSQGIGFWRVAPPLVPLLSPGFPRTSADDYGRQVIDLPKKKGVHWTSVNALGRYGGAGGNFQPHMHHRLCLCIVAPGTDTEPHNNRQVRTPVQVSTPR